MCSNISSKTKAAKGPEVRIRRNLIKKDLIRRLMLQEGGRKSIYQIDNYEDTITLENKREIGQNL